MVRQGSYILSHVSGGLYIRSCPRGITHLHHLAGEFFHARSSDPSRPVLGVDGGSSRVEFKDSM